ncbi:Unconventional prefoldin RPB5 interactor [Myotis davidii]|uniref:Unconventional prefoldin RPB5 interactor n=1 Tax=Myotis davidii TaxID=225400 RepID=L5LGK7_MYODS|nr:Unconventional prefoldin RPB5 interactor [Myotis davidii]
MPLRNFVKTGFVNEKKHFCLQMAETRFLTSRALAQSLRRSRRCADGGLGVFVHRQQVEDDYSALQERLSTLPEKLSYSIMVPFGPFAFMPGKLVHTNEVTVLLGDNWFAKCSAKQAVGLVEHRKGHGSPGARRTGCVLLKGPSVTSPPQLWVGLSIRGSQRRTSLWE